MFLAQATSELRNTSRLRDALSKPVHLRKKRLPKEKYELQNEEESVSRHGSRNIWVAVPVPVVRTSHVMRGSSNGMNPDVADN